MEKKYIVVEPKKGNIFLKPCGPTENAYNFDIMDFFIFYKAMMEKISVKPPFTTFH